MSVLEPRPHGYFACVCDVKEEIQRELQQYRGHARTEITTLPTRRAMSKK